MNRAVIGFCHLPVFVQSDGDVSQDVVRVTFDYRPGHGCVAPTDEAC